MLPVQANPYYCAGRVTVPAIIDTLSASFFNRCAPLLFPRSRRTWMDISFGLDALDGMQRHSVALYIPGKTAMTNLRHSRLLYCVRKDLDSLGLALTWWQRCQDRPTWKAVIETLLRRT